MFIAFINNNNQNAQLFKKKSLYRHLYKIMQS